MDYEIKYKFLISHPSFYYIPISSLIKNILFVVLVFISFGVNGQSNLDTLWSTWQNTSESDSVRFKSINLFIIDGYLRSEPDSALIFAKSMLDTAITKSHLVYTAQANQLIAEIYDVKSQFPEALKHFAEAEKIYTQLNDKKALADLSGPLVNCYRKLGDFPKSLEYAERSLKYHESVNDTLGLAWDYWSIAIVYYSTDKDLVNTQKYMQLALNLFEKINYKEGIARVLNGLGYYVVLDNLGEADNYEQAIEYLTRSMELHEEVDNQQYLSYNLNNLAVAYMKRGEYDKALGMFTRSSAIKTKLNDKWAEIETLIRIGQIYLIKKEYKDAFTWCDKSLTLSIEVKGISWRTEIYKCLYEASKGLNNLKDAIKYNDIYHSLADSLALDQTEKRLQEMEFSKQILADSLKQEAEKLRIHVAHDEVLRKKNKLRDLLIGSGLFILLVAGGLWSRLSFVRKSKIAIEKEKERSESLLLNILPYDVAEELKLKGSAVARDFDQVSILFTDFKEFTQISEILSAKELVAEINHCFKAFDFICGKYGVEKIKTIGDSYMAAGGLPVPMEDSVKKTVLAALEMAAFIVKRKAERETAGQIPFEMRTGIHTGNVVAGIVGVKKFQYDVWGDTVNTASRMESNGIVGEVNISHHTYEILKDDPDFVFEARGKIQAKGKGEVEMYFVRKV